MRGVTLVNVLPPIEVVVVVLLVLLVVTTVVLMGVAAIGTLIGVGLARWTQTPAQRGALPLGNRIGVMVGAMALTVLTFVLALTV